MHGRRDEHDDKKRAHARTLGARIDAPAEHEIAAVREINEHEKAEHNGRCGPDAHSRLDVVPRLVPVRQIERHQRGWTQGMPDRHIVGNLRQRNEGHEEAEHGEQRRCQPPVSEVKEDAAECGEHEHIGRPDEEVIVDQRTVPRLLIRPSIEERERHAPEHAGNHRPDHAAREERNARAVLHEHEDSEERDKRGEKILRAHVLPHIDITRDECQEIHARRRRMANPFIRPLRREIHNCFALLHDKNFEILPSEHQCFCMRIKRNVDTIAFDCIADILCHSLAVPGNKDPRAERDD